MTLEDIRLMLVAVDPDIKYGFSMQKGAYSYWEAQQQLPFTADDRHEEGWRFYVHRFTRDPRDNIAERLFAALDENPATTVARTRDLDPDTGYYHIILECEGW